MIELIIICVVSVSKPSNPPPPVLPEKIIAVIPPEVEEKEGKIFVASKKKSLPATKDEKQVQRQSSKRQYKRRGTRNK